MFACNNKISNRQLQILIISNAIGIGIISIPQILFGSSIINLVGLLILILGIIFLASKKNYNSEDFLASLQKKIGPYPTKILLSFLLAKIILTSAWQLKLFSDIVKIYVLPKTPSYIVISILILTSSYLISKGYEVRARLSEILIWLIILPLAIVFFITIFDIKSLPKIDLRITPAKIFESVFVFSQLDYLFLYKPFGKKNSRKKILSAVIFSWLAILLLTFILKLKINFQTPYPIIKLMSITDIPGGLIQNYDFFIISFIIITFFSLSASSIFFSSWLFKFLGIKKFHIPICATLIFLSSMLPKNFSCNLIYILGTFFYFVFPLLISIAGKKAGGPH